MRGLCKFAFLFALTSASWVSDFKNRAVLSLREEGTLDEKAEQIRKDVFQILSLKEVLIPFFLFLGDSSKIFITLVYEVPDSIDASRQFSTAKIGQKDSATEATLNEADCADRKCCDVNGCYRAIGIEFRFALELICKEIPILVTLTRRTEGGRLKRTFFLIFSK